MSTKGSVHSLTHLPTTTNNCLCGSTSQVPFVLLSVKRSIIENYPTSVWEGWKGQDLLYRMSE